MLFVTSCDCLFFSSFITLSVEVCGQPVFFFYYLCTLLRLLVLGAFCPGSGEMSYYSLTKTRSLILFTVSVPIPLTSHNCSIFLKEPVSFRYSTIVLAFFSPIPGRIISSYHSALFKSIFNFMDSGQCLQPQSPEATNADLMRT